MLAGGPYDPMDPELVAGRARSQRLAREHAAAAGDVTALDRVTREWLGGVGLEAVAEPGLVCDYGSNVFLADRAFLNFQVLVLDCARVEVGELAQVGPRVQLLAADHPRDAAGRRARVELTGPVSIVANAWIGAGAIVCPGVSVGEDTIVGAGSVVTRSLPAGVVAAGSPARVLRELER